MGSNMEGNWHLLEQMAAEKPIISPPGSSNFKRTFPLNSCTGQLDVVMPTCSEEHLLQQHSSQYQGMKLLRGIWQQHIGGLAGDASGTYFPLAAPGGEVVWCSAGYCLMEREQQQWRCDYGQLVMKGSPSTRVVFYQLADLSWLTDGVPESELLEFKPSQPACPLPAADVVPDIGFMRTTTLDLRPQQLFIPCADQLYPQQPVCIIGFASKAFMSPDWAATFLRTEADYEVARARHRAMHHTDPPDTWQLDSRVALQRAFDLTDEVCYPNMLAVAPGQVAAATERIVEHTCSSFPGMSGSPGVDIRTPWKLLFVHTRADSDFRRSVNYGYSVNHPMFVKAYVREVLPKVLAIPRAMFQPGMMECLQRYLIKHQAILEDPGVLNSVAKLM